MSAESGECLSSVLCGIKKNICEADQESANG